MASPIPIAVIGMSCRFAGEASSPEKLWKLCAEAKSAWSEFPASRFNQKAFYHPNGQKLNTMNVKGGHFLSEDLALFDAGFFNFTSELAAAYDPQFRLQLECTYEALESAGLSLQDVAGSNTSVFAGAFFHDYNEMHLRDPETLPRSLLVGVGAAMAANRLSHFYDLRGTSQTIDTGCSTTLVAFHQACQSIASGDSDMSVVSASNLILNPDNFMVMSNTFLSTAGRSFAFDSRASGYGRGEGSATVLVKRLDHALRDGDPIRAVVRATAVNQDGKTETITTPSQEAQAALIRECYRKAGLDPDLTTYFEAHGTGTPTGDPIEAGAVASSFAKDGKRAELLKIGSVKTNVGHTETVSGLASIIKVVMALGKQQIPPSINFETPNPNIPFEKYRLQVATKLEHWPKKDGIRRASVNNFGYGGANAHLVLEDYSSYCSSDSITRQQLRVEQRNESPRSRIFQLSGKDEQATVAMASNLIDHLSKQKVPSEQQYLDDLAYTLGQRRSKFPWVNVQTATTISDLTKKLESSQSSPRKTAEKPKIGFVFTGQGAQWWAMGRELIGAYPVFKDLVLASEKCLQEFGSDWNLIEELTKSPESTRVNELAFSTPLCAVVQIGLVELLKSWGVNPAALCSHSSGEVAAAYASGSLSLRSAMAIVFARGQVAGRTVPGMTDKKGGMIATGLSADELEEKYLPRITKGNVVVACLNSPTSTTASGDIEGVVELEEILRAEGIFGRRLKIDCAYHSHHMKALSPPYFEWLDRLIKPDGHMKPDIIYASPTTGKRETDGARISGPQHWVDSFGNPVQFTKALHDMCFADETSTTSDVDIIIEIGPHAALLGPIQETLAQPNFHDCKIKCFPSLVRKSSALDTMHALACELIRSGHPLDLGSINFPSGSTQNQVLYDLPSYPWNHSMRHWSEPRANRRHRHREHTDHDLLGSLVLGTNMLTPTWRHVIRLSDLPWLRDHVIQTDIVFPGAGFICMAIQGSQQLAELESRRVSGYRFLDIEVLLALVIPDNSEGVEIQMTLTPTSNKAIYAADWKEFHVYSVNKDDKWTEHCKGLIKVDFVDDKDLNKVNADLPLSAFTQLKAHGDLDKYRKSLAPADVYDAMHKVEIKHGPIFQNLSSVRARNNQAVATFTIADTAATQPYQYQHDHVIHPTTLDILFQFAYGNYIALPGANMAASFVPRIIKGLYVSHNIPNAVGHEFRAYSDIVGETSNSFDANVVVVDHKSHENSNPKPLIKVDHYVTRSLGDILQPNNVYEKLSTIQWHPDISLANGASLKKALCPTFDTTPAKQFLSTQRLCLAFMNQALQNISSQDVSKMQTHYKYFYYWMVLQAEANNHKLFNSYDEDNDEFPNKIESFIDDIEDSTSGHLIRSIGPKIASIMKGKEDISAIIPETDLLAKHFTEPLGHAQTVAQITAYVKLCAHKQPGLQILQIDSGNTTLAEKIFQTFGNHVADLVGCYDFTDSATENVENAQQALSSWQDIATFRELDVEKNPEAQNFEAGSYDLVILSQNSTRVRNTSKALTNIKKLLKPGGSLLFTDARRDALDRWIVFGLLPEWWQENQQESAFKPSLSRSAWDNALREAGFDGIKQIIYNSNTKEHHSSSIIVSTAPSSASQTSYAPVVLVTHADEPSEAFTEHLVQSILSITGKTPAVEPLDTVDPEGKICIFLGDVTHPLLKDPTDDEFLAIRDLCTLSKGVLWLTRGAAKDYRNIDHSLNQGFLRCLRTEYAGKRAIALDLDPTQSAWSTKSISSIERVFRASFNYSQPILDFEYAERGGVVEVPRFYKDNARNTMFFPKSARKHAAELESFHQDSRPLKLAVGTPGLLDTLAFVDDTDAETTLKPQQVQICPKAFGANFRDVMSAMGQLEATHLGFECAGTVTSVGSEAARQGFKIGDRVAALMKGNFSSVVRTKWTNVVHIPEEMSFEVAASLPKAYSTAYVSLMNIARVQKDETVLIHAAAGGLGQAAIRIAKHTGAEVFVTASTHEKQQFLHDTFDIPFDHIFNSRDKSFAAGILGTTKGRGVDVVLNTLAGSLLQESFNCVAQFGRFVEVGKKDFESDNSLQMGAFTRSISFSSFDLLQFEESKGDHVQQVLKEIIKLARVDAIAPALPLQVYPLSDVERTFRLLQTGKHMGKFVLSVNDDEQVPVLPHVPVVRLRADASYLVVGGLGGIGKSVCEWLIDHGARNLIVMSRSASAKKIQPFSDEVAPKGVKVYAAACDIADKHSVQEAFDACDRDMPIIRGVIQGAMVLHDSLIDHMEPSQWNGAVRPKVHGSWNLHERLHSEAVDFFVLLSSLSGVVGLASQCNYAAGNAFQDALAKHRLSEGLHAAAIDIGVVQAVGVVAENDKLAAGLKRSGYKALMEDQVLQVLESAITSSPQDPMLIGIEGADWSASGLERDQRFTPLKIREARNSHASGKAGGPGELSGLIAAASSFPEAVEAVITGITKQLVDIFMMDESEVDPSKALTTYGVDSLSAVELRNMLALRAGSEVTIFQIMQATSITGLATIVAATSVHIDESIVPAKE